MDKYEIIKATQGWRLEKNGEPVAYYGEYGFQGVYYKDEKAYDTGKGVCYIAEYEFENSDDYALFGFEAKQQATSNGVAGNPYVVAPNADLTTRAKIEEIAKNLISQGVESTLQDLMFELFWAPDWQCIETYASEME